MRNCITCLFLLAGASVFGQISSLNGYFPWFEKCDVQTVKSQYGNIDYTLETEKDSLGFHYLKYKVLVVAGTPRPSFTFVIGDSALTEFVIEHYDQSAHRNMVSHLKSNKFKTLNADVNGDFITTSYDNGTFILNQDYEVVDNPNGKGQIPHYRYRMVKKNGVFDALNGAKKKTEIINGKTCAIIENFKNGVLDGERITYYPGDSIVKKKENYRAGRLNGLVSDFDTNGQLSHSSVHSYHWKYGIEKWYDINRTVIKSLQWQRDIPVGTEKYLVNGRKFNGPAFKNGLKEGMGTVPVNMKWNGKYDENAIALPEEVNWDHSTANSLYFALETVLFVQGLKTGKAIGMSSDSNDTLYVAYYKNGLLDSVYSGYQLFDSNFAQKNEPRFTTTFVNGLENGKRTFCITSGPLKGDTSYIEPFRNGKLDGEVIRYYRKEQDQIIPPTDPEESSWAHHPIKYIPGEWMKDYSLMTYKNGVVNGPYRFQKDSMHYNIGTYVNGELDGRIDQGMVFGVQWIRKVQHYSKGFLDGESITEYLPDSTLITENYQNGKKHGIFSKKVKGKLVEERSYVSGYLYEITEFTETGYNKITLVTNETPNVICYKYEIKNGDYTDFYQFAAKTSLFPKTDTVLVLLRDCDERGESMPKRHGKYEIRTPNFVESGNYSMGKLTGYVVIEHKNANVYEQVTYDNGAVKDYGYTNVGTSEAYTGNFISDVDGSSVSVKNGLRHGWFIEYDKNHVEIRRTKYVKGILKKTIEG